MKTSEQQFEEWANGQLNVCIPSAWQAWKASRETLVVELPERYADDGFDGLRLRADGYLIYVEETIDTIERAGVKVVV